MVLKRLSVLILTTFVVAVSRLSVHAQNPVIINLTFDSLKQGTAGIVTVTSPDVTGASADVFDRTFPFFPTSQGFASFIAAEITQKLGDYALNVTITSKGGGTATWTGKIKVLSGGFIAEDPFTLPPEKAYLVRDDIQKAEDDRLLAVYSVVTPERYWEGPLTQPVNAPFVSPFGGVRTFNGVATRRHTGADMRAAVGTPVLASASGRVIMSRQLDIHGENVIIDHGWGLFTEYAHLSQRFVVPGQFVLQGDLIGLSGTTGRATGPHLHWEVAVNGIWVDPVAFMTLKLPN
ncbi:MAG TPA: M23 family metallopeptidase [Aggregatilineales bacterium]|nr:M23 family metallopeptidase [Aggregatilineales bacterium]